MRKVLSRSNYSERKENVNHCNELFSELADEIKLLQWQKNKKAKENRNYC
jgi:hypothetical protein